MAELDKPKRPADKYARHRERHRDAIAQRNRERRKRVAEKAAGRAKSERCEACGEPAEKIVFDHCHRSGRFRGWICDSCNKVLGFVKDSKSLLARLIEYLDRTQDVHNTDQRDQHQP